MHLPTQVGGSVHLGSSSSPSSRSQVWNESASDSNLKPKPHTTVQEELYSPIHGGRRALLSGGVKRGHCNGSHIAGRPVQEPLGVQNRTEEPTSL